MADDQATRARSRAVKSAATAAPRPSDGHISADCLYTLAEIKIRLGLGTHALRMARRKGLRVLRVGRCGFVAGEDLMQFIRDSAQ